MGLPSGSTRLQLQEFLPPLRCIVIVSGGLQAVLEGSEVVRRYFAAAYGCQLTGDTESAVLKYIKRSITFAEKTRYLFEINKGIDPNDSRTKPFLVNQAVEEKNR